uniref:Ubiquitin-like protease family profile domain-containing protein n=1 Tax=Electrophorus electricus TaxID=8005 RepID=A0A4W4DW31_ELEEL
LGCLDEGELLNDVILDFYLKYLVCEKLKTEDANRCHVFSSFFYRNSRRELLCSQKRHNRVKTWTRRLDLFEKDFIFVPINELAHWYLVVICFPGQVSHCSAMDSRGNRKEESSAKYAPSLCLPNPMSLFYRQTASEQLSRWNASVGNKSISGIELGTLVLVVPFVLRVCVCARANNRYLEMEWWVKKGSRQSFGKGAMKGWSLQVPQQDNNTDCGLYLLQYVESFITNPPQVFHPAVDLSVWFPQEVVKKKREKIKRLIFRLHHQQSQFESGKRARPTPTTTLAFSAGIM